MYGIVLPTLTGDECKLWLAVTPEIEKYRFYFARESKAAVHRLLAEYSMIHAFTPDSFERSKQWLRWIGFEAVGHTINTVNGMDETLVHYVIRRPK